MIVREHPQRTTRGEWSPFPGAPTEILRRSEFELLYGGARGGGKTESQIAWFAEPEYINHPGYKGLQVRKNSEDLGEWVERAKVFFDDLVDIVGNPPTIRFKAGGYIRTGHLKDKNAYEKYLGHEYQKVGIDQLEQIPDETSYLKLISCCRSVTNPELKPQVFGTANPGGRGHAWVKRRWVDCAKLKVFKDPKTGRSRLFIPATVDDNPALVKNDPGYIGFLEGLPEPLKSAWRYGKWDLFVGQYFANFGEHLKEEPYKIEAAHGKDRIVGSLDYGYGLYGFSSYGHTFVDPSGIPHRCFTWYRQGLTASEQANDLFEYIDSFWHTDSVFPHVIVYDNNMDNRAGLEKGEWAPIDYFKQRFRDRKVSWEPANKHRVNGWQIMLDYFQPHSQTTEPKYRYWPEFNGTFEEVIPLLIHDENNPSDVLKCDIDHVADECRYGLVKIRSMRTVNTTEKSKKAGEAHLKRVMRHLNATHKYAPTGY